MSDRQEQGAEYIKEVYDHLRSGSVESITVTTSESGSVREMLITDDEHRAKIVIGEGEMKNWR